MWTEIIDKKILVNSKKFEENKVPGLKEFILELYSTPQMHSIEFGFEIKHLCLKIDQIIRKEFDALSITKTYNDDLYTLLRIEIKDFHDLYIRGRKKDQEFILSRVNALILNSIVKQNHVNCKSKK